MSTDTKQQIEDFTREHEYYAAHVAECPDLFVQFSKMLAPTAAFLAQNGIEYIVHAEHGFNGVSSLACAADIKDRNRHFVVRTSKHPSWEQARTEVEGERGRISLVKSPEELLSYARGKLGTPSPSG